MKSLRLWGFGLNGRIPEDIAKLDQLEYLGFFRNAPRRETSRQSWDALENLKVLGLSFNALTGVIPTELTSLSKLEQLWLKGNRLTGSVSPKFGEMKNLRLLRLAGNKLQRPFSPLLNTIASIDVSRRGYCSESSNTRILFLKDCLLLMSIKDELAGKAILDWNIDLPVETWEGVAIGGPEFRVHAPGAP